MLPNNARTFGRMSAVYTQWLALSIVVHSLPYMMSSIEYGTFLFFAYFYVLEAKGVLLEDTDTLLGVDAPLFARPAYKNYL